MARCEASRAFVTGLWGLAVGLGIGGAWVQAGGLGATVPAVLLAAVGIGLWSGAARPERPAPGRWWAAALLFGVAGALWTNGAGAAGHEILGRAGRGAVLFGAYAMGWAGATLRIGDDEDPGAAATVAQLAAAFLGWAIGWAGGAAVAAATPWGAGAVLWSAGALVLFAARAAGGESERWRRLWEGESPYHHVAVEEGQARLGAPRERRLVLDGATQSGEFLGSGEPSLPYVRALERWLVSQLPPGPRVLFLGGGAATLARRLLERDPRAEALIVEIDPVVIALAQRFFGLRPDGRLRVLQGEARAALGALQDASAGPFEAVVVDVYGGGSDRLPFGLVTMEAFAALRALLAPRGSVLFNAIAETADEGAVRLWSLVRTLAEVFPRVDLYPHRGPDDPDPQNVVVVAGLEAEKPAPDVLAGFRRWPSEAWPPAARHATLLRDLATPVPAAAR